MLLGNYGSTLEGGILVRFDYCKVYFALLPEPPLTSWFAKWSGQRQKPGKKNLSEVCMTRLAHWVERNCLTSCLQVEKESHYVTR